MEQTTENLKPKMQGLAWGPIGAIFISLSAYLASQLILILPMIAIGALNPGKNISDIINNSSWINLAFEGISAVTMLVILWLFLKRRGGFIKNLSFKKFTKKDFGWMVIGIAVYFSLLIIALLIANAIPGFNANQTQDVGYQAAKGWQLLLAFIGLVMLPPFAEEMLFRGFLYRGLTSKWPKILSAFLASILFAAVHFQWNVGIDVFVLSLVMIFLLEKTKNLWVCIGLHTIKNFIAFMAIFVFASH
jgi:hypothetical protein